MKKCIYCSLPYKKGCTTSFHRFPSDLKTLNMWLENMKVLNWTPKKTDSLCSEHFEPKCFYTHWERRALNPGSVPTLFKGPFKGKQRDKKVPAEKVSDEKVSHEKVSDEKVSHEKVSDEKVYDENVWEVPIVATDEEDPLKIKEEPEVVNSDKQATSSTSQRARPSSRENSKKSGLKLVVMKSVDTSSTSQSVDLSSRWEYSKTSGLKRIPSESTDKNTPGKNDEQANTSSDNGASESLKDARIQYGLQHDHRYHCPTKTEKTNLDRTKQSLELSNQRVKVLTQHVRRLNNKVTYLKTVINDLKKGKVSKKCMRLSERHENFQIGIFNRIIKNAGANKNCDYPPELQSFAKTLHLYSPQAYMYVRSKFNLPLPHPREVKSWFNTNVEPDVSPEIDSGGHESEVTGQNVEESWFNTNAEPDVSPEIDSERHEPDVSEENVEELVCTPSLEEMSMNVDVGSALPVDIFES